jgi:hypothetical protein
MRLAVIGCGTIAQIMHIPNVVELPETDLVALCDPGGNVTTELGHRYNVPPDCQYTEPARLIADRAAEIDAVVVTTPMQTHADVVERTLDAGLATFVEKPLAVTPDDADRLVEAAAASDATAMVGYNRRFEPAYERFAEELAAADAVDSVLAHAVDADFSQTVPDIYDVVDPDLPAEFVAESDARRRDQCKRAIDTADDELAAAYDFHLEHICHDLNALRGLFGAVEAIEHVDFVRDRFGTAHLVYEGGERVLVQSGPRPRAPPGVRPPLRAVQRGHALGSVGQHGNPGVPVQADQSGELQAGTGTLSRLHPWRGDGPNAVRRGARRRPPHRPTVREVAHELGDRRGRVTRCRGFPPAGSCPVPR